MTKVTILSMGIATNVEFVEGVDGGCVTPAAGSPEECFAALHWPEWPVDRVSNLLKTMSTGRRERS